MKNYLICLFIAAISLMNKTFAQNMAINTDGSTPDASAMLDITSTTKGFLAPRLTTTQQNAIVLPAKGLLIYNTTDNAFRVNIGTAGAPVWTALSASSNNWLLTGNSGTNASTNYLGTNDNVSMAFRTYNVQRMVIDAQGRVGIGVTNPTNPLTVKDTLEIRRVGSVSQLLFANTSGSGDFRIGGDGGDIFWQGGGGRNLQMGAFWGVTITGDRQTGTFPAFENGVANTSVLVMAGRDVTVPLAIQGYSASQTANLTEWRNTSGVLNFINKSGNMAIGATALNASNPEKLLVDAGITSSVNAIVGKGNINSYLQLNIQNNSSGASASSDVVATANNGDESNNYVDMGINGGSYTGGVMGAANDGYLYTQGNNFLIGTGNASKSLIFLTGGTTQSSNERMRIDGNGNVGIGLNSPAYKLQVVASSNPLQLSGLQTGANTDSVLTVSNGVVRMLKASALSTGSSSTGWATIGNAGTSSSTNFLGTTDAQALQIKQNNNAVGRFEANSVALGLSATTYNSTHSYAFGSSATVAYNKTAAMALGNNSAINGDSSFALGTAAISNVANTFAIGNGATANSYNTFAIGRNATTAYNITDAVAIGTNATANSSNSIAIGSNTSTSSKTITNAASSIALGNGAVANSTNAVVIGTGASTGYNLTNPVSIGVGAVVNGANGVAIGNGANISYLSNTTVIGAAATASTNANNSTAIGYNTKITKADEIILGDMTNTALGVGIGSENFSSTNKEKLLVDAGTTSSVNAIVGKGSINSYLQLNIQNTSTGTSASSDVVATANNGDESSNYVDMGINGGNYSGGVMGAANDGYLYTQGNNFLIGTANALKSLIFMTGGTSQSSNERMRIDGSGNVGIGNISPTQKLDITGNLRVSGAFMPNNNAGSIGNFLQSNGAGAAPTWIDPSAYLGLVSWTLGGNSVSSVRSIGTTSNYDLPFITNNTEQMRISAAGNVGIGSSSFSASNPEQLLVDAGTTSSVNAIAGKGNINSYLQLNIQNNSSGNYASSDVVATANNGDETNNYIDMGMNGGGYSGGFMGSANDGYLYTMGNNFLIGTGNASKALIFMTGGTTQSSNERMRVDGSGNVGIGNTNPNSTLTVTGSQSVSYRSGTGSYTVLATDYVIINTGGSTPTWTIPAASTCAGRVYRLVNQGTTAVTLSPAVTTASGVTSTSLLNTAGSNNYEIISDGSVWRKMN